MINKLTKGICDGQFLQIYMGYSPIEISLLT